MSVPFTIDPRILADSRPLASLPLSDLLLKDDARYPWLLMLPRRAGVSEIIDLAEDDRALLLAEIALVSTALKTATGCLKLNIAAFGNVVPQLHVHVIARFANDAAWPQPVWGIGEAVAYQPADRDRLVARIRAALPA